MLTRVSHVLLGSANLAKCWNSVSRQENKMDNDSGFMAFCLCHTDCVESQKSSHMRPRRAC